MNDRRHGIEPGRGDVWTVNEPSGRRRSVLIVSDDQLNRSPAEIVVALPFTASDRDIPAHLRVLPPEGGLLEPAFVMSDQIRTVPKTALGHRLGTVSPLTMGRVDELLRLMLSL